MKSKHLLLMLLLALLAPWAANAQSPLFSEDFESGSMPTGWTTDGSGSWSVSTGDYSSSTGAGQGSYNAMITHGTTDAATKLITPEIDLSSVASAELSFMHVQRSWAGDIDGLKVYYRTSSSGTWTLLEEYTSAYASWTTEEGIVLPNLSSTYQVAFEYIDHWGYGLGVDNVIITQGASCVKPSTLTATAPYGYDAAHCILLQWEDGSGSYNVQLKKASESEEQWQTKAGGVSLVSMLFNDLDPLTTYNARVQSVCGGDVSDWKNVTFTTACAAISVDDDNNYTYGFEDAEPFECWTAISGTVTRISGTTHADSYRLDFRGTTSNMIAFPQFTNATNTLRVEFWTRPESNGGNSGKFAVGYMTDLSDASTFVAVETYNSTTWTSLDYVKKTVDLVSAPANAIIVFRQFDCSTNYYWYVDDVTVKPMPSCVAPTALNANASTNSAELSWTANSGETAWTLYYKKTTDENYTEVANVTENPYTLPGLTAATNYQFYVVANCSATDISEGSAVKTFATECEVISAVGYSVNFDEYTAGNNVLPTCWSYINTTTYSSYAVYPRIYPNSSWTTYAHSAPNCLYLYSYAYYSGGSTSYDPQPQYAILPEMTGLAGMQVALYAKGYNTSSTFKIGTMSNPNDASTFTMIAEQTLTTSYPADAYEYIIPTTCTDNYLAIMIDAATSTRTTNGVYIDDIDIHEPPSCAKPTNVTATTPYGHGATINWNAGNDETAWQICVIDNNVESAPIDVTSKPHTLSGLDPETTYQVKVRANCGGSFSEWTNAISFTTTVVCPAPTSLTGEANEFDATITWQGTASSWEVFYSDDNTVTPDDNIDGTATSTTYTKTGLPLGDHYFWVRAICGGEDGNSSWAGPVSVHIGYCVPSIGSIDGTAITNVTFGTGDNIVNNSTASVKYGDYTAQIGSVQAGVEATVSITYGHQYTYGTFIWVDFDNSLTFEDDEVVYYGQASGNNPHTLNATFTIPATQATGDYVMRIGGIDVNYGHADANSGAPCYSGSWAAFQDYTLRLLEAPSCLTPTDLAATVSGNQAEITWTSEATAFNIDINGTVIENVTSPYTFTGALATEYEVKVQTNCGTDGTSEWTSPVSFTTDLCLPANQCELTFELTDAWGDGWNGNYISVVDVLTNIEFAQLTNEDLNGTSGSGENELNTINLPVCDGREIQFQYHIGDGNTYPEENSWVIKDVNDEIIWEGQGSDGESDQNYTVSCAANPCKTPKNLTVDNIESQSAELSWTGEMTTYNIRYRHPQTNPTAPATIILEANDVWGDGSGYQMLLDADATAYGTLWNAQHNIFVDGVQYSGGDIPATYYDEFEYKVPTEADGSLSTTNVVVTGTVTITIPAGIYDYVFLNPTPGDQFYVAADNGNVGGAEDNFVFEPGVTYHFTMQKIDGTSGDGAMLTVTPISDWVVVENVTSTSYTLTGLTPLSMYECQVKGFSSECTEGTEWSESVTFTTDVPLFTKTILANSWYALSSPVNTPNVTDVTNLTDGDYDFYRYNEVTSTWENYKAHRSSNFTTFENGRGYIYRRSNNATLTFTGVPNTAANYPYILTAEGSGDLAGFNLLGNPYATDYNYSGVCYNLTEKGTWKVNATGYNIPVCEAILIKVESETPCSFTSSKSAPKAAEALAFTVKGNGYEDVTYAMLEDGKGLNKVAHLADEAPALSIPVDGSNYAIAYLGYEVESFPLTLNATAGEYTIALNNQISGLSYCHLLDKVTGKETDLLKGAYTFKANGNSDRFTVLLNASLENGEIAIWNGNSWIVNGEGTLQVFDVMGRRVYNQEVAGQSSLNTDELATGVYVIRLGEKSQKIVVK